MPKCIGQFVKQEGITKLIMGDVSKLAKKQSFKGEKETQFQKIVNALPEDIELLIVEQQTLVETELEQKIG